MIDLENTIDSDDEPDGSEGGYTRNGNYIVPDAMREIVYLRREVEEQRSLISELRRENQILKEDCERLRQKLQQGPKCANCCGYGTVEKPWGTHAPCEACNGKGF